MGRFYSAADIFFLMPSLAESFGLMAIEAMAYECPVIVFENTVLPEITFAPLCGLAVKYKSGRALKDAVEYLISDPEDRIARGRLGRELVFEHYRYSDYVNKHLELYEAIMKR
jgi:glycosyltransferase involved in cell wall biosynthesis